MRTVTVDEVMRWFLVAVVCAGAGYWAGARRHSPDRFEYIQGDVPAAFDRQTGQMCNPQRLDPKGCLGIYQGR